MELDDLPRSLGLFRLKPFYDLQVTQGRWPWTTDDQLQSCAVTWSIRTVNSSS